MSQISMDQVLAQMRVTAARVAQPERMDGAEKNTQAKDFGKVLKQTVAEVNSQQHVANNLAEAHEMGVPGVNLAETMVAIQKAELSFKAVSEVRNKLVSAYLDIMNMPV